MRPRREEGHRAKKAETTVVGSFADPRSSELAAGAARKGGFAVDVRDGTTVVVHPGTHAEHAAEAEAILRACGANLGRPASTSRAPAARAAPSGTPGTEEGARPVRNTRPEATTRMSMVDQPARVSLAAGAAAAICDLCTADTANANIPRTTVIVRHPRGGSVELAACDWCVEALRRLSAVTGGHALFVLSEVAGPPPSVLPRVPRAARPASPPVLVLELQQQIRDTTGTPYVVRVYGRERMGGMWEGWLEFVAVGAALVRRTSIETTQSDRAALTYWATGLEPAYLQGAFARAQGALLRTPST